MKRRLVAGALLSGLSAAAVLTATPAAAQAPEGKYRLWSQCDEAGARLAAQYPPSPNWTPPPNWQPYDCVYHPERAPAERWWLYLL